MLQTIWDRGSCGVFIGTALAFVEISLLVSARNNNVRSLMVLSDKFIYSSEHCLPAGASFASL